MAKSPTVTVRVSGDAKKLRKALKGAESRMSKFGGALKKIGKVGAAGLAAVGTAAVGAAFKFAETGDRIAKTSRAVGFGIEAFQELEFAMGQMGLSTQETEKVFIKFNKRIGEAAEGEGAAAKAVERLGLSLRDTSGEMKDQDRLFSEVIGKLQAMESSQERAAAASDFFGDRAGPKLATAIEEGEEGIDALRAKARDLGAVMSEDTAKQAEKFQDALDDVKKAAGGLLRDAVTPLMGFLAEKVFPFIKTTVIPTLETWSEWIGPRLKASFSALQVKVEEWWPAIKRAFETVAGVVESVFATFTDLFAGGEDTLDSFHAKTGGIFEQIAGIFTSTFDAIKAVTEVSLAIMTEFWDRFGNRIFSVLETSVNNWLQVIGGALDVIQGVFEVFAGVFTGDWSRAWDGVKQIFGGVWDAILGVGKQAVNVLSLIIGAGTALISQAWSGVWEGIKATFSGVWNGIVAIAKRSVNTIIGFLNALIRAWNSIDTSFTFGGFDPPGPGPTIPSFTFPDVVPDMATVPRLARGGIVSRPTLAMVGESGPEAVIPLNRGGGMTVNVFVEGSLIREQDLVDDIGEKLVTRIRQTTGVRL